MALGPQSGPCILRLPSILHIPPRQIQSSRMPSPKGKTDMQPAVAPCEPLKAGDSIRRWNAARIPEKFG
jgi:hypothetical protein